MKTDLEYLLDAIMELSPGKRRFTSIEKIVERAIELQQQDWTGKRILTEE